MVRGRGKGKAAKGSRPGQLHRCRPAQVEESESESECDSMPAAMDGDSSQASDTDGEMPSTSARPMGAMPCVPRTEHVDDALRRKIRKGEFVDFKYLIPHPRGEKPRKRFAMADGFFEEVEDMSNLALYNWIDAYVVFMSVTLEFHPSVVQGMLRHFQVVKRMCAGGKDGIEYDFQFRRLKCQIKSIRWGEYLPELAGEVKESTRSAKKSKSGVGPYARRAKRSQCHGFNSPEGCRFGVKCIFRHQCSKCYSPDHSFSRCSKK